MYSATLVVHSLLRWLVLAAGLTAVFRAFGGSRSERPWDSADNLAGLWFIIALDLQLLLGLLLYARLSPITQIAFLDFAGAMRNPTLRFWAVEHGVGVLVAVVLAHVGRVRVRRAATDAQRHSRASLFFAIALLAIIASIPWPGLPYGRPLFRW
jgi:hypothetical protein